MNRVEKFKSELSALLKKYRANIELEEARSHGYGDAFPQKIVAYLDGVYMPDGETVHEPISIDFGEFINPE